MSYQSRDRLLGAVRSLCLGRRPKAGLRAAPCLHVRAVAAAPRDAALPGADGCAQPARCRHLAGRRSLRIGQAVLGENGRPALILRATCNGPATLTPDGIPCVSSPRACAGHQTRRVRDQINAQGASPNDTAGSGPEIRVVSRSRRHFARDRGDTRTGRGSARPCRPCWPISIISSTGAVAIVSGRPICARSTACWRRFIAAAAGEHGVSHALRRRHAARSCRSASPFPTAGATRLSRAVERWPGVRVETKPHGVAVHYRLAPEREAEVWRAGACPGARRSSVVSPDPGARGGRDRPARRVQGPCRRAADGACAVPWPPADLRRRRFHRRGRHEHGAPVRRRGPARRRGVRRRSRASARLADARHGAHGRPTAAARRRPGAAP